jgi:hypothetical protein
VRQQTTALEEFLLHGSMASVLSEETYPFVFDSMVNEADATYQSAMVTPRSSLTWQMRNLLSQDEPDCYLFTANSAIPAADAIRGFYEASGKAIPDIGYIRADRQVTRFMKHKAGERLREETNRLGEFLRGAEHVCIVDQYVMYGDVIKFAKKVVETVGAPKISLFNYSRWYHDALQDDIDLAQVTSTHSAFMHFVGASVARRLQAVYQDN